MKATIKNLRGVAKNKFISIIMNSDKTFPSREGMKKLILLDKIKHHENLSKDNRKNLVYPKREKLIEHKSILNEGRKGKENIAGSIKFFTSKCVFLCAFIVPRVEHFLLHTSHPSNFGPWTVLKCQFISMES